MASIDELPNWTPAIDRIEETDEVLGGENGKINVVLGQLADRTKYLKDTVGGAIENSTAAKTTADEALSMVEQIQADAGSTATNAQLAEASKVAAQAAQALAAQSSSQAQSAQAQSTASAQAAAQSAASASTSKNQAISSASAAVAASNTSMQARDQVVVARDATLVARDQAIIAKNTAVASGTAASGFATAAQTARAAAQAAATLAQAARDSAVIGAGAYDTEAEGRAAVADGENFKVLGDGDVAFYEYQRVNSTTSELKASYPSVAFVQRLDLSLQTGQAHVQRQKRASAEVFNGAQFWNGETTSGADGDSGGFFIPALATGQNSYLRAFFDMNIVDREKFKGRPTRFYVVLETSESFSMGGGAMIAVPQNKFLQVISTAYTIKLSPTSWVIYFDYIPTDDDTVISVYLQKTWPGSFGVDFSAWAKAAFMVPQDDVNFQDAVESLTRGRDSGDIKDFILPSGEVFDGAGRQDNGWGISIPQGSKGLVSYQGYLVPVEAISRYAGAKIRLVVDFDTSVDFTAQTQLVGNLTVYTKDLAPIGGSPNEILYTGIGRSRLRVEFFYTLTGEEKYLRPFVQVGGASMVRSAAGFFTFRSLNVVVDDVSDVAQSKGQTVPSREEMARELRISLSDEVVDSGDLTDYLKPISEVFNGGVLRDLGWGVTVPQGQTGVTSYVGLRLRISGITKYAGNRIRLLTLFEHSANFFGQSPLQMGLTVYDTRGIAEQRSAPAAVIPLDSTVTAVEMLYEIQGDEVFLRPYYQVSASAQARTAAGYFTYKGMTLSAERALSLAAASAGPAGPGALPSSRKDISLAFRQSLVSDPIDSGDLLEHLIPVSEVFNGGVLRNGGLGFEIPAGAKGNVSYAGYKVDVSSISRFVGAQIRINVLYKISPDFLAQSPIQLGFTVWTKVGNILSRNVDQVALRAVSDTLIEAEYLYTIQGDEGSVRPFGQVLDSALVRTATGTMDYMGMRIAAQNVDDVVPVPGAIIKSKNDLMLVLRTALVSAAVAKNGYIKTVKVAQDGSGDYTSLKTAWETEGGGLSDTRRVEYQVFKGEYIEYNGVLPPFADVTGIGRREEIILRGYRTPDTTPHDIEYSQTFWWNTTGHIRNLTIFAQNMRYPIHSDSGASSYRALQVIEDCHVEHIGNEEARAWQSENGGDPAWVWTSEHAWGCGTHSGQRIISLRTKWRSRTSPFYFHNNRDFAEPCILELDNSEIMCTTAQGRALWVQPLGSGTPDRLVINNCRIDGRLELLPVPMLSQKKENYRGNQNDEVRIYISGSSPVAWTSTNESVVLELVGKEGPDSGVAISGSAAPVLFGAVPDYQYGGVGYAARVRSSHAIYCSNGFVGLDLGTRLGDRTGAPLTLNILFDGSGDNPIAKSITLGANYTGMSNGAVVAALNAALADPERAFYESDPYDGVAHVFQLDREHELQNVGSTVILKGQVVAYAGSRRLCRRATSADARVLLAGIALENMAPNRFGRVQFNGRFTPQQLAFDGTPAFAFGDSFGVGSNTGQLVEAATVPLLLCIETEGVPVLEIV